MGPTNRRRSSLYPGVNVSLNATPVLAEPDVDEEAERRGRLKLQKRQSIGHATPNNAQAKEPISTGVSGYSAAQLADLYSTCMKLSAENKINVKNAFHLQLIDYMAEMMKTKKSSDLDNFQAASVALDASAKIYAYRVDSVHGDTLKLAGGVGKSAEEGKEGGGENNDVDNDQDVTNDDEAEKKKPKRVKKRASTVEKNLNNIDVNKFDLEFDVDPLFKKTSVQFDSGGGGGQFLCNLYVRDEGCQMLLDSEAYLNPESLPVPDEDCQDLEEENPILVPKIEAGITICPPFSTFSFKDWSLENEDPAYLNLSLNRDDSQNDDKNNDAAEDIISQDQHAFDVNAPPMEDFNDMDNDIGFGGADDDDFDLLRDGAGNSDAHRPGLNLNLLTDMKQRLTSVPNEYSYFDDGRLKAWAGPKHWKFKPFAKPAFLAPRDPAEKKKKVKEPIGPHNFDELYDEENDVWKTVEKTMKVPEKAIKLQNKTMVNWSEDKLLLPTDLHYKGKDFAQLFIAPELLVTHKGTVVQSVDDSINEYDYDNANDADDFCPNVTNDDIPMDNYNDQDVEEQLGFPSQTILPTQGDLLVAAPNKVEKLSIGYAKQAKKMDMRKLKSVEWNILVNSSLEQNKENSETNGRNNPVQAQEMTNVVSFDQLYKNLSESKQMSSKMVENLSVPLAFVALLHLCNERNLALESMPDFSNFTIRQG